MYSQFDAVPREPVVIAKWLLMVFAVAVLAYNIAHADAPDVIILSFALLPWFVGPAALAAILVAWTKSRGKAWLFVAAEATAVFSTAFLWTSVALIKSGSQNAQAGIALIIFPLVQFFVLLVYVFVVMALATLVRWKQRPA